MLSFSKGKHNHCAALASRPTCLEDGCRKDCPLIENINDLSVVDENDARYNEVMTYNKCTCVDYTRNDYRASFITKSKEELIQIKKDIEDKINNMLVLHKGMIVKLEACDDVLKSIKK